MKKNIFSSRLFLAPIVFAISILLVQSEHRVLKSGDDFGIQSLINLEHSRKNSQFVFRSGSENLIPIKMEYARGRRHRGPHGPY